MTKIIHYADILAIPCFLISIHYFYNIKNKNLQENFLFLFSLIGFILDISFTIIFFSKY